MFYFDVHTKKDTYAFAVEIEAERKIPHWILTNRDGILGIIQTIVILVLGENIFSSPHVILIENFF